MMIRLIKPFMISFAIFLSTLLAGCAGLPDGVEPVKGFEVDRYLGKWYEIARLDHPFERGLSNITAEYRLRDDGDIDVINRGFKVSDQTWSEAIGRAKFVGSPDTGQLKVSFFGPFYGGYNIVELDKASYQYVMIVGNNRKYLWLLSREPKLDDAIQQKLIEKAKSLDFPIQDLIWVEHDKADS